MPISKMFKIAVKESLSVSVSGYLCSTDIPYFHSHGYTEMSQQGAIKFDNRTEN